jgi:hypothetical protein
MVYGVVKNGVIEIEGTKTLHEGTRVRVEPIDASAVSERGSAKAILERLTPWNGDDEEWDRLERQVQQLRDQDLEFDP